ncbi:hypothetical protein BT67DRAFT_370230 [Trichocladium antarcticum]|uniref:Rap-GAP domain-containing protein n=1 Tax=Trichocladium antarcticum TaxID=1450529 RepID=A0AAN6UU42_9PEZI|nr:hypothetical protein BT67DRAFT_370230 [Trichocladium antarcticum]
MSPSPGDEQQAQEVRNTGVLAGVFKGLAGGGKLTKSPPVLQQPFPPIAASQTPAGRSNSAAVPPAFHGLSPGHVELVVRLKDGQLNDRMAAANSLRHAISDFPLNPVLDIWHAAKDLIDPSNPPNVRRVAWELLTECIKYPSSTDLERHDYFSTLTAEAHQEDFPLQLAALEDLTSRGRNIAGFHYEIFPLLTRWLQEAYEAARTARRSASRGGSRTSKGKALSSGEGKSLSQLFALLKDVIKFNFKFATDGVLGDLMGMLLEICMNTSVEDDLRACINVIDAMVTFGAIPNDKLKDCVQVLSSIHCLVPNLQKDSWHTISIICRSHHGQSTVRILLDLLRAYSGTPDKDRDKDEVREVRGALSVLQKLLHKSAEKGYPTVPLPLLVDGLTNVSKSGSTRIAGDILKLVNSLFDGREGTINAIIAEEHWAPIFWVAAQCATKATHLASPTNSSSSSLPKDETEPEDSVALQLRYLVSRIETLLTHEDLDFLQRDDCMVFLTEVQHVLPDSAAGLVVAHLRESRGCFPSEVGWKDNLDLIMDCFYLNRSRDPSTRLRALGVIIEVYDFLRLVEGLVEEESVDELIQSVLSGLSAEDNTLVLQETVAFLVNVAETAGAHLFDSILEAFSAVATQEKPKSPLAMPAAPTVVPSSPPGQTVQTLPNVVTRGYVQIFIRALSSDGSKSSKAFTALVHIAGSNSCEITARLTAMKMLFRLRADSGNHVYLTTRIGNDLLAGTLYKTESSLARKLVEDASQPARLSRADHIGSRPSRGISFSQGQTAERGIPARSASTPKPTMYQGPPLWSLPDADALPECPPSRPSRLLASHKRDADGNGAAILDMGMWLDALMALFHQGCDWEVHSFILVHLPAQLSNHPIFRDAIPHIQELRRVLCRMVQVNSFQDPPHPSGLRRTDVANCLFHSLVMVLSYHQYFQKVDEDEIVSAFTHGIADKTAKTCIHALSVCCHELPMSVSKSLVNIVQKMSQVITQPFVAVHILEFLACLSRQNALYSNFREDDYRVVFGICIRYLQYVRGKKHSMRGSAASEPATPSASANQAEGLGPQTATDDLPQYVYALAYHVITFWFLAVKLPERPQQIAWIAKNLFTDVDGSASYEEQAQITLDFMQRVAFSDAPDSAQDPLFMEEYFGEIQKKRWIIGNSLVTIQQAKETGWAEVTRRYPSGTSSFAIRVEYTPMPNQPADDLSDAAAYEGRFQHGITIFPSHLLMQLLAPMPQMYDPAVRPIPLPDEEAVDRAIRNFDRNSAVDGHKVGVIYIKEGQTQETEMLANTIGGPDYLNFLKNLGSLTKLKGATFNTQGLDRENDIDGQYAYCWRDRVTEIVFHVTTQMPTNLEHDAQCIMKKRHIGNDFVNIVWNDSGLPFRFDTFPSQFNYVYIVITPTPRLPFLSARQATGPGHQHDDGGGEGRFCMVQVMSQPGFPQISPAAEPKMISLRALPSFVRLLALNASVFSLVWANREGGEHVSSWRNRLREISRLRERHAPKVLPVATPSAPPAAGAAERMSPLSAAAAAAASGGLPVMASHGHGHGLPGGHHHLHHHHHHHPGAGQQAGGIGGSVDGGGSRAPGGVRDSFSSLRRSSVATFFTSASADAMSHRSSMLSTVASENTEAPQPSTAEALVDSVDFSKWT